MYKNSLCDFGIAVKKRLIDLGMSNKDLIAEIKKDTELYMDSWYLNRILKGERTPPKIIASICKILDITEPTESEVK